MRLEELIDLVETDLTRERVEIDRGTLTADSDLFISGYRRLIVELAH